MMSGIRSTSIPICVSNTSLSIEESEASSAKNVYVQTGRYDEEFEEMSQLGCGGFGTVCKAVHKFNGNAYAIKKIPIQDGDDCVKLFKELKILANLNSDYVVKYYSAWMESNDSHQISMSDSDELNTIERSITQSNDSGFQSIRVKSVLYIQMELCSSTLKDTMDLLNAELNQHKSTFLTSIGYYIASELFIEILESVEYLHKMDKPVIHRDLKPANILITDGSNGRFVKIADFGLSTLHEITKQTHTQGMGTIKYMAPEVLNCRNYNTKADIYSLGVIMKDLFHLGINTSTDIEHKLEFEIQCTKYMSANTICQNMTSNTSLWRPSCEQILPQKSLWSLNLDELLTDKTLIGFEQRIRDKRYMSDKRSEKFYINFIKQRFSQRGINTSTICKETILKEVILSSKQLLIKDNNFGIVDASNYLINIFENIKQSESAKLDPLVIEETVTKLFEDNKFGYSVTLNIESGAKIMGISKIEINNFEARLNMNESKLEAIADVTLAVVRHIGKYDLRGRLYFIPISENGLLSVELRNITGKLKLNGSWIDHVMKVESLDINMSFSTVSIDFENQPPLLNGLINFLAKPIVELLILRNKSNMEKINRKVMDAIAQVMSIKEFNVIQNLLNFIQKYE